MNLVIKLNDANRFKHRATLEGLSSDPLLREYLETIDLDLAEIYRIFSHQITSLTQLVRDRSLPVDFAVSEITNLRTMQKGISEMMSDLVFNLEMRATP